MGILPGPVRVTMRAARSRTSHGVGGQYGVVRVKIVPLSQAAQLVKYLITDGDRRKFCFK